MAHGTNVYVADELRLLPMLYSDLVRTSICTVRQAATNRQGLRQGTLADHANHQCLFESAVTPVSLGVVLQASCLAAPPKSPGLVSTHMPSYRVKRQLKCALRILNNFCTPVLLFVGCFLQPATFVGSSTLTFCSQNLVLAHFSNRMALQVLPLSR